MGVEHCEISSISVGMLIGVVIMWVLLNNHIVDISYM